jgi:hypothetical protein
MSLCRVNQRFNIKKKDNLFFKGLLLITIAYNSGSALGTVDNRIGFALMIISIFFMFLSSTKVRLKFKVNDINIYFALLTIMLITSFIVNSNLAYFGNNLRYFIIIFFSYIVVKRVDFDDFKLYYINTMVALICISLVPFYLINYFKINIHQYLPILKNINGVRYHMGILFNFYTYSQARNIGIFWEPSIYSSFIILAIVYEICYKKSSFPKLGILFLGLISTGSTGGFFLIPFLVMLILFRRTNIIKSVSLQFLFITAGILSYLNMNKIFSLLAKFNPLVFGKLIRENSESILERFNSPNANMELFYRSPIFGYGLGNVDELYSINLISQTSTSTYYLAAFGLIGIIYSLTIVRGALKQKKINLTSKMLIAIIFILIVNKEPHTRLVLSHILIFYLIKDNKSNYISTDDIYDSESISFSTNSNKEEKSNV